MRRKKSLGFSLIELMTVMAVALVIMAIAVPNFLQAYQSNRLNSAMVDLSNIVQRTRYEAVRLNRSIACRVQAGPRIILYIDLNGDSVQQPTEATITLPGDFQFNTPGTPGAGSMGIGATVVPPLRLTFNGRGSPDYSATAPGMALAPASPILLTTIGNSGRPQDGYRALTVSPTGKLTIWRAPQGGTWNHAQ